MISLFTWPVAGTAIDKLWGGVTIKQSDATRNNNVSDCSYSYCFPGRQNRNPEVISLETRFLPVSIRVL